MRSRVSVDEDVLVVDEDIFLNVTVADHMNGQNLSIDDVADLIVEVADLNVEVTDLIND
jgi:hypothetical protein